MTQQKTVKYSKYELERNSLSMWGVTMLISILNYIFQIFSARILSVDEFGILNYLLSLLLILAIPANILKMWISKETASLNVMGQSGVIPAMLYTQVRNFFLSLLCIMAGTLLFLFWRKTCAPLSAVIFLAMIAATFLNYMSLAIAQGFQDYIAIFLLGFCIAIFKLLGLAYCVVFKISSVLNTLLFFIFLGTLTATIVGVIFLQHRRTPLRLHPKKDHAYQKPSNAPLLDLLITNICTVYMANADILFINLFFGNYEAGIYSSVMFFGKGIGFSVGALASALLPIAAKTHRAGLNPLRIYQKCIVFGLLISIIITLPLVFFGEPIIRLFFGAKYLSGTPYLIFACLLASSAAFCTIHMNFAAAVNRTHFTNRSYAVGVLLSLVLTFIFSSNIRAVLGLLSAVFSAVFLINYIWFAKKEFNENRCRHILE